MDNDFAQLRQAALELAKPLLHRCTVILTGSAAGSLTMAQFLSDAGAHVVPVDLGITEDDTRIRFAAYERALTWPAEVLQMRLNTEDPEGSALVYAGSFTSAASLFGRDVIGSRSPRHLDAERKDRQCELLGVSGHVVCLDDGLEQLNLPSVVQGIPDNGIAMATSHTYLLPRSADCRRINELTARLKQDCKRAAVKEFDAGMPCTFYGFVTDTTIVDFGPIEALVYWDPRTWRLHATGILLPLVTPESVLASARDEVHAIARRLHRQFGYVGAFGVDGVLTENGYAIHEINPRVCAGFSLLDKLAPQAAPLAAIDLVLREIPGSSTALIFRIASFAEALQRQSTPAYRFWENPSHCVPAPTKASARLAWAQQIRKTAAMGRRPISELEGNST